MALAARQGGPNLAEDLLGDLRFRALWGDLGFRALWGDLGFKALSGD